MKNIDLSGIMGPIAIKNGMGDKYTSNKDKQEVLDKLYNLQAKLENKNIVFDLKIVDDIITYIEDFDKSLSQETKEILNSIALKVNFK
jgi:hypothetical protein